MLVKCPECNHQISDKALACPNCGYPLSATPPKTVKCQKKRKRRLPNGFGQITEIKGRNLRKPFRAMVTVGKTPEGKPICKLLKPVSFFETYNEAYTALLDYNRNPYGLDTELVMEELYEKWEEYYLQDGHDKRALRAISYAWPYCHSIASMRVRDVRSCHIAACLDNGYIVVDGVKKYPSAHTKNRIKSLLNIMFDYAVRYGMADSNYARSVKLSSSVQKELRKNETHHISYTDDELDLMWKNLEEIPYIDLILIQCYSGWRPRELTMLKLKDVDLINWTFTGGMKTASGINRLVPIHSKIRPLVQKRYDEARSVNSDFLFIFKDSEGTYKNMDYDRFKRIAYSTRDRLKLNPEHKPHDGRVTFVTMAKKYNLDEYAIKYIVGHHIKDITERVYTERTVNWLQTEMEKIK